MYLASEVFKPMKDDPDNPFGSIIRQKHYIDKDGNKQLSALNIMGPNEGEVMRLITNKQELRSWFLNN